MQSQLPKIAGTFTGFLHALAQQDVNLAITQDINSVTLTASRWGKRASVTLSRQRILDAVDDIASVELGEIISAVI